MVGEAPAHNEGTGRGFYALLMASRLVGPPLRGRMVPKRAMSEAENACGYVGARGGVLVLAAVTDTFSQLTSYKPVFQPSVGQVRQVRQRQVIFSQ
jgi:hypothetical protein